MEIIDDLKHIIPSIEKFRNKALSNNEKLALLNIHNYYKNPILRIEKTSLRKTFLKKRENLSVSFIDKYSFDITKKFIQSSIYKDSDNYFVYISFGSEFNTSYLINQIFKDNKRVFVPYLQNKDMLVTEIDKDSEFKTGKFGIKEPINIKLIDKSIIDIAIVPGILFNHLGFRIGYGGGYYDKFLKEFNGISVSFPFQDFIDNSFIPDYYDIPVDIMFTDN